MTDLSVEEAASSRRRIGGVLPVAVGYVVAGALVGVLAKLSDGSGWYNDVGGVTSQFGIWIVLVSLIAVTAGSAVRAAVYSAAAMAAAMIGYYVVQNAQLGYLPTQLFLAWLLVSVTAAPLCAVVVHAARGTGWRAVIGVAAPVSLVLEEGLSRYIGIGQAPLWVVFDIVAAALLLIFLPRTSWVRLRAAALVVPGYFVAAKLENWVWSAVNAVPL